MLTAPSGGRERAKKKRKENESIDGKVSILLSPPPPPLSIVSRTKFGWRIVAAEKREQTPFDCKNSDNVSLVSLSWRLPLTLSEFISSSSECHIVKLSYISRLHLSVDLRRDAYTF